MTCGSLVGGGAAAAARAGRASGCASRLDRRRRARRQQARTAAELEAAARAALADRPDELARFETVLGHAREIGYLTEGHNYWIDRMSQARLRDARDASRPRAWSARA